MLELTALLDVDVRVLWRSAGPGAPASEVPLNCSPLLA